MSEGALSTLCTVNPESLGPSTRLDFTFDYVDIGSVSCGQIAWNEVRRMLYRDAPSRARRGLHAGDVLLCTVRPGLQSHCRIVSEDGLPKVGSTGFAVLRPNRAEDSSYLFHQLFSNGVVSQLRAMETGSNYPAVNERDVSRLSFYIPNEAERSRIGAVLDALDAAIEKTAATVAKLKQVRAGLLHDLLTCGLDENGELRDPLARSEDFAGTPLGAMPRKWHVDRLATFLVSAEYGISSSLSDQGTLPVLRMNNLSNGESVIDDIRFATGPVSDSLLLRDGDVLFNRTNSYEHVGRTGIWRAQLGKATFASYLVRLNPNADRLRSEMLNLILNMPECQLRMRRYATPSVQQVNINPTNLQRIIVGVPSDLDEQDEIVLRAKRGAASVDAVMREHTKLKRLKAGLMSDLLTGRVPVPETIEAGVIR